MEVIGRFPEEEEATHLGLSTTAPVWLGTRKDTTQITSEIIPRLCRLREELSLRIKCVLSHRA